MNQIEIFVEGQLVDPANLPIETKRDIARMMFPGADPRYFAHWDALRTEDGK